MSWNIDELDLDAYLARVGYDGPRTPTLETLRALHRAHVTAIPFENLDVVLGRGIDLGMNALQDKMVTRGRGGYCHEHNLLFAAALERLGFRLRRHLARVRLGRDYLPRTHATLTVEVDGVRWVADVGFGGQGLVEPIVFAEGATARLGAWRWRLGREGAVWVLHEGDTELYAFTDGEPDLPSDFEVANFYVANSPRSPFIRHVLAQRTTLDARIRIEDFAPAGPAELADILRNKLGIPVTDADAAILHEKLG
ncbi:arylamine N-acetyltransferase [Nonomuraea sp. NPDC050536]|uniref:arylamine N-acetyltransferase n=1 Tax=Nonomuraea sp. NPDC050536 TaxID=3364366 RepID=UPI0037C9BF96